MKMPQTHPEYNKAIETVMGQQKDQLEAKFKKIAFKLFDRNHLLALLVQVRSVAGTRHRPADLKLEAKEYLSSLEDLRKEVARLARIAKKLDPVRSGAISALEEIVNFVVNANGEKKLANAVVKVGSDTKQSPITLIMRDLIERKIPRSLLPEIIESQIYCATGAELNEREKVRLEEMIENAYRDIFKKTRL